eukprot:364779-Chlamydomonas_euryale.AAC.27
MAIMARLVFYAIACIAAVVSPRRCRRHRRKPLQQQVHDAYMTPGCGQHQCLVAAHTVLLGRVLWPLQQQAHHASVPALGSHGECEHAATRGVRTRRRLGPAAPLQQACRDVDAAGARSTAQSLGTAVRAQQQRGQRHAAAEAAAD